MRTAVDRGQDTVFTEVLRSSVTPIFATRDDVITLLARNDPALVDRLRDLYNRYGQVATALAR